MKCRSVLNQSESCICWNWTCSHCTLINEPLVLLCLCGNDRDDLKAALSKIVDGDPSPETSSRKTSRESTPEDIRPKKKLRPNSMGSFNGGFLTFTPTIHGSIDDSQFILVSPLCTEDRNLVWLSVMNHIWRGKMSTSVSQSEQELDSPLLRSLRIKKASGGKLSAADRIACLEQVRAITTYTSGKWIVFVHPNQVEVVWRAIACATAEGTFYGAKVGMSLHRVGQCHLICVYCPDFRDLEAVEAALVSLLALLRSVAPGLQVSSFKPDIYTLIGINSAEGWGGYCTIHKDILAKHQR